MFVNQIAVNAVAYPAARVVFLQRQMNIRTAALQSFGKNIMHRLFDQHRVVGIARQSQKDAQQAVARHLALFAHELGQFGAIPRLDLDAFDLMLRAREGLGNA